MADPRDQIRWMLEYIRRRYGGAPESAYDRGGQARDFYEEDEDPKRVIGLFDAARREGRLSQTRRPWLRDLPLTAYDRGGVLPPGISRAFNDTDHPESVEPADGHG